MKFVTQWQMVKKYTLRYSYEDTKVWTDKRK